jgi:hypothetical protein
VPRVVPSDVVRAIDRSFPSLANLQAFDQKVELTWLLVPQLAGIVDLVSQVPSELLSLEPGAYTDFLLAHSALRHEVDVARSGTKSVRYWPTVRDRNALAIIRDALSHCPDEAPAASSAELKFIADEDLRNALRVDLGSIETALRNGEWKAATVLAGSVVEALLL